jgi:hypothetical protein
MQAKELNTVGQTQFNKMYATSVTGEELRSSLYRKMQQWNWKEK